MFECGIGEQYASDDHSGFADDSGESDAFIACQFISSHRYHRLSPMAIAGVDKWVMLGIGIVIWVIGAIMSTAAFFSLERGMCDDASGVDHIAEHERLRIASDDFVEDVECVFHARFGAHESDVVPHRLSQEVCIGEFIVGDESRTLEFGENGDGVALSRREAIFDIDADASPKDESFEQRIARQAICAMNARSRDFATSPQAIDIGSSELVDADATHVIVRGRRYGELIGARIEPCLLAKGKDGWEFFRKLVADMGGVEEDFETFLLLCPDTASDDVARRELGVFMDIAHESATAGIEDGAFAA